MVFIGFPISEEAKRSIEARVLIQKLKALDYVFSVQPVQKSLTDKSIIGAMVYASSEIRKDFTLKRLRESGWNCEDRVAKSIYIKFFND